MDILKDEITNEVINRLDYHDHEDCCEQLDEMAIDMESVKTEITTLKMKIRRANIFRPQASYELKLDNLALFFQTRGDFMSEYFYCKGELE